MVAHIIAKAAWQVLRPHAKIAAGHVARGFGSLLSSAPKPAVLPALNTHLLGTFAAPTAAAGAAGTVGLAARHGRGAVHGATHAATHGATHHGPRGLLVSSGPGRSRPGRCRSSRQGRAGCSRAAGCRPRRRACPRS